MTRPTSRRRLFGAAVAVSVAAARPREAAPPVLLARKTGLAPDPVVTLYHQYLDAKCRDDDLHDRFSAMREALVAQYGEPGRKCSADGLWGKDPRHPALLALLSESNAANERLADAENAILDALPVTAEGFRAKVLVTLGKFPDEKGEYYEQKAYATLREVATWLAGRSAGLEA